MHLYRITREEAEIFYFKNHRHLEKEIEVELQSFEKNISGAIYASALAVWTSTRRRYEKLFPSGVRLARKDYVRQFNEARSVHLKDLKERLSGRVWKMSEQFKSEIELNLQLAFKNGMSANNLATDMKKYLNKPDMLFRRVKDEFGHLHLSKAAKAYNPGRGVYRSSYKNARRMIRTEINRAYRLGEHEMRQNNPFVIGFEVKRSNNPYDCPLCQSLAGVYPKDFLFTGWHPQCRCYTISILKDDENVQEIKEVPNNFKKWCEDNRERSRGWEDLPNFIKDNKEYTPMFFNLEKYSLDEKVFVRHTSTKLAIERMSSNLYKSKYSKMTSIELAAIHHYTRSGIRAYRELNTQLRNNNLSEFNRSFSSQISTGLNKLPDYQGLIYRGSILNSNIINKYKDAFKSGKPFRHVFFTSGSKELEVANGFLNIRNLKKGENKCIFVVESKTGKYIHEISEFNGKFAKRKQYEVLFDKGKQFNVVDFKEVNDIYYFKLVEL